MPKHQILSAVVALLLVACLAQGTYIHHLRKVQAADPAKPTDAWLSEVNQKMKAGQPVPMEQFDKLFDDQFFSHRFDPFQEIENFSQKVGSLVQADQRAMLNDSWGRWVKNRMDLGDLNARTITTPRQVVVAMKIPDIQGDSLKVDVNKDRIRLSYKVAKHEENKDKQGQITQLSSATEDIEKIMPVPDGANAGSWHLERQPDMVKLVFDKAMPAKGRIAPMASLNSYKESPASRPAGAIH